MTPDPPMKVLYELPVQSHAPNDGVSFWNFVRFEIIPRGACFRSGIRFKGVVARHERGESCSTEWHHEADDRLVEIENSDWVKEICAGADESARKHWQQKHHYMIELDEAGCLEVIADGWELMPAEEGEWPKIRLDERERSIPFADLARPGFGAPQYRESAPASMKVLYELAPTARGPDDGASSRGLVRFAFARDHALHRGAIEFVGMVVAQRQRAESCCTAWHRQAAGRVVEIENSAWLNEIYTDTDDSWRHLWKDKHHYMIYLDAVGSIEVIAEGWRPLPAETGEWPKIRLK